MSPRTARPPAIRYRPARRTDVETLAELGARTYRVASIEKRLDKVKDEGTRAVRRRMQAVTGTLLMGLGVRLAFERR